MLKSVYTLVTVRKLLCLTYKKKQCRQLWHAVSTIKSPYSQRDLNFSKWFSIKSNENVPKSMQLSIREKKMWFPYLLKRRISVLTAILYISINLSISQI